ncbi:thioesterase II family protein [Actinocrispum wychmicini]|uniref:thioesterase II family protein n=1 Tax=Actinocrispum wychmicini TaxID=1213861 RepID=UPI0014043828|nr:alpha/beta fold hydrolase [Actinocrispum wychmicini]
MSRRHSRPDAPFRLYCFPYVGGLPGEYLRWDERLTDVEVCGVVPPGRGERLFEPAIDRLDPLVDAIVAAVPFRPPFALFGHSLGALVAFQTARVLTAAGRPPACLFVSGHRPPQLPQGDVPIHGLPPDEFRSEITRRYPAAPAELVADDELYGHVIDTFRADLAVFETYRHVPGPPLPCPLVVLSGVDDAWTADELSAWRGHTSAAVAVHLIPGDHFYLRHQATKAVEIIGTVLRGLS